MRLITGLITLLIWMGTSLPALAEPLFIAVYQGKYSSLNITMTRTLEQSGNNYRLTSKATSFMARIDESSFFSVKKQQLQPLTYDYSQKIFGVKRHELLTFDWQKNTATFTKNNKTSGSIPLPPYALDPTLYQLQLQRDLTNNPTQGELSYTFVRRNQTKTYAFTRQAEDTLQVNGKAYKALIYARINSGDRQTRIWLIPDLDYVIAKIQHIEDDGDTYEVLLSQYQSRPSLTSFLTNPTP